MCRVDQNKNVLSDMKVTKILTSIYNEIDIIMYVINNINLSKTFPINQLIHFTLSFHTD